MKWIIPAKLNVQMLLFLLFIIYSFIYFDLMILVGILLCTWFPGISREFKSDISNARSGDVKAVGSGRSSYPLLDNG